MGWKDAPEVSGGAAWERAPIMGDAQRTMPPGERARAARAGTLEMLPGSAERTEAANLLAMGQMQPEPSVLADVARAIPAGLARGVTGAMDLPGAIVSGAGNLVAGGLERAGLVGPTFAEGIRQGMSFTPMGTGSTAREGVEMLSGGASEYQPQTTPGQFAGTVSEFLPGGAAGPVRGMATRALQYGVLPGLASEAAGQLTEGTAAEPYARTAAALGAGLLASRPGAFAGDDEAARMANVMREAGVDVTAGQARQSQPLMRMEGRLAATGQQLDDFTAATMSQLGSTAKTATPTNLAAVERTLVQQMDDAVRGVDITPTPTQATAARQVAADYIERVPAGQLTPRVRGIAREIEALAAGGKTVPLSRLKTWRSDVGNLTVSPDAATREAAHALRTLLDDMTDTALTAAGRADDIAKLGQARQSYRNYIGVRDAASRAGAEGGILSPQALNQSMIRAQGREAYATGRSTPMTDFTRSGAATLRPAPTVLPGGVRTLGEALPAALAAAGGAGALSAGLGPLGIGLTAIGGAMAPAIGQMAMRSGPVQSMLRDPTGTMMNVGRTIPGLLAQ